MWMTYISLEFLSVWSNYGVFRNKNSKHVTSKRVYFNLSFSYSIFFCQNFYFIFSGEPSKLQSFKLPRDEFILN